MANPISDAALDVIFRQARTHSAWLAKPVGDDLLRAVYDLAKLGPTSANTMPMRIVFVKSPAAKQRLKPALQGGNVEKTMAAPVTAIFADDLRFYEYIPRLFPAAPAFRDLFTGPENAERAKIHAFRNATLQAAYFIIAARALGLDCGPMSGFDNAKVDAEFLSGYGWRSNFLVNIGHGDPEGLFNRSPRLDFDEACKLL
jgi:3-hydroxypropanoate dehydrogenase